MTLELIGILAFAAAFIGMFREPAFTVYAFFFCTLLGSAAAFVLTSLGGTNISPAHFLLGFLAFRLLNDKKILQDSIGGVAVGRPGFWLLLATVYAVVSAFFLPRMFAGQTYVYPVRNLTIDATTALLEPTTSNLTQSVYLIGDFVCFFVIRGYGGSPEGQKTLSSAVIGCAILNLMFAVLDTATYATNTTELLSFIRNANYSLLNEAQLAGFKRIVGSFVEASLFGTVTLGYFAFTIKLWLLGVRPRLMLTLSMLSLCAIFFSASSTAYVGLGVILLFIYAGILLEAAHRPLARPTFTFIVAAPIILAILSFAIALNDSSATYFKDLADQLILNKLSSGSGMERSSWNSQTMQAFYDTYSFGAGNGSLRASSLPVAALGSVGIIGTTLFALFFIMVFGQGRPKRFDPFDYASRRAAKFACFAWLVAGTISGALIDIGITFFALAGFACSEPVYSRVEAKAARTEAHFLPVDNSA